MRWDGGTAENEPGQLRRGFNRADRPISCDELDFNGEDHRPWEWKQKRHNANSQHSDNPAHGLPVLTRPSLHICVHTISTVYALPLQFKIPTMLFLRQGKDFPQPSKTTTDIYTAHGP